MHLSDQGRAAAALASLGAGPGRLRKLLEGFSPLEAYRAVAEGEHPADPGGSYRLKATSELSERATEACERCGVSVLVHGEPDFPASIVDDPRAPGVLFCLGDPRACDALPRVAIVGTRNATPYGLGVASELGRDLAQVGVAVVSGLAKGIDCAAHGGALGVEGAPAAAVLGTAHDGALGSSQRLLMRGLAERGVVLSELVPGAPGAPRWWFAVRNRLMAAMAHVVVVVESHLRGGAMHTVRYANERSVPVAAVPGSVRSAASAGSNSLLVDGACAVRDADDVLSVLELAIASEPGISPPGRPKSAEAKQRAHLMEVVDSVSPSGAKVLNGLDADPAPIDKVVTRCGLPLGEVALALEELADAGLAECEDGWWSRMRG